MPLHSDSPNNPLNLSDTDYWSEYERFKTEHPDAVSPVPAEKYETYDDDGDVVPDLAAMTEPT